MHSAKRFECYLREEFVRFVEHNPISGHSWINHGPTTAWSVIGPSGGPCSRHRTLKGAETALIEWQEYFDNQRELHQRMEEGIRQMHSTR